MLWELTFSFMCIYSLIPLYLLLGKTVESIEGTHLKLYSNPVLYCWVLTVSHV